MNFYSFKVNDIFGKPFDLATLKGKKVLVVNTASECGYTPQFEQLEEVYKTFGNPKDPNSKFEIIGFPSNDFGAQDPGKNEEIAAFCHRNYGVTFPMMEKITLVGENAHPVYKWLKETAKAEVTWNFHKFLVDEQGNVVKHYGSNTLPIDDEILTWIETQIPNH